MVHVGTDGGFEKTILFFSPHRILDEDRLSGIARSFSEQRDVAEFEFHDDFLLDGVKDSFSVSVSEEIPVIEEAEEPEFRCRCDSNGDRARYGGSTNRTR